MVEVEKRIVLVEVEELVLMVVLVGNLLLSEDLV